MKRNEFPENQDNPRKECNEHLRENIIRLAISEFSKAGYNGISLDVISRRLKISKKTLYHFFPTKRDLYIECCLSIFFGVADLIIPIFNNKTLSPFEKLSQLLNTLLPHLSTISPILLNDLQIHFPDAYREFLSFKEFMILRYKEIFYEAQSQGIIRQGIDIDFLIDLIIHTANYLIVPEYIINHNTSIREVLERSLDILLYGIVEPKLVNSKGMNL